MKNKICEHCKNVFYRKKSCNPSRFKERRFCSPKCSRNSRDDVKLHDFGMIGRIVNKLMVVSVSHKDLHGDTWFKCLCTCGKECLYRKQHIDQGNIVSCGHERNKSNWENNYEIDRKTGCWIWKGASLKSGYGFSKRVDKKTGKKRNYTVHRLFYRKFKGEIPKGLLVCHHCDNRICCNPDHLFLGTHKDNYNDMVKKNRRVKAWTYKHLLCGEKADE